MPGRKILVGSTKKDVDWEMASGFTIDQPIRLVLSHDTVYGLRV
jgi:hypothetical protein